MGGEWGTDGSENEARIIRRPWLKCAIAEGAQGRPCRVKKKYIVANRANKTHVRVGTQTLSALDDNKNKAKRRCLLVS